MTSTAEVSWSVPSQVEFGAVPHRATRRTGVRRARDGEGHYVLGRWGMAEGQSPYVAHDLSHSWLRTTPPVTRDVSLLTGQSICRHTCAGGIGEAVGPGEGVRERKGKKQRQRKILTCQEE
jgi:hypothetical protein